MTAMQEPRALLERVLAILDEIYALSLSKQEALLTDDPSRLESISLREEVLSKELRTIDACSPQVQFFLNGSESSAANTTELKEILSRIIDLAGRIKATNNFNQTMLKDELQLIQFSLNSLISSGETDAGIYNPSGRSAQKRISLLDTKR